jgi:hypothetical protein
MERLIKSFSEFTQINESSSELRKTIKDLGFSEKGEELSSGGEITDDISKITKVILEEIKKSDPAIKVTVTAGNDKYHQTSVSYDSRHKSGSAVDFTINPSTDLVRELVVSILKRVSAGTPGFSFIDEYSNPSAAATGKHFHISYIPNKPETQVDKNVENPISVEGLTGNTIVDSNSVTIDSDFVSRLVSKLKEKGFSQEKLDSFTKQTHSVELSSKEDEDFYKAILKGLGANETPEKIKFLKAWRQGEGGSAKNNPFNTTKDIPGDLDTKYNSVGVRNYPDRQSGLDATLSTLKLDYYKDLVNMLKNDNITAIELANSAGLDKWGTGPMARKVLAGGKVNPPKIAA